MTKQVSTELAHDEDFVDLGEVSIETEGNPTSLPEGAASPNFQD